MVKTEYLYNAKIINVVDGDTVDLEIDLGFYAFVRTRIRLIGLDTAETNSKDPVERDQAQKAKAFMMTYLNSPCVIQSTKKDKYGRFLATVYV